MSFWVAIESQDTSSLMWTAQRLSGLYSGKAYVDGPAVVRALLRESSYPVSKMLDR